MNYTDIIRLTSGLLQFGVACYALRLGRLFNAAKVGWLLFSGLSLLALAYILLPINPFRSSFQLALKADLIYALISVLLLAGMVHLDLRFKQRQQAENAERKAQSDWELEVEKKFLEANKVNEDLQQTIVKLQAELAQQKQTQEQSEKTNQELLLATRQTEADLRQTIEKLQTELLEQKQAHIQAQELAEKAHQTQLSDAHQAGVTEGAASVLPEFGTLVDDVNSISRAAGALVPSGVPSVTRVTKFIRQQARASRPLAKPDIRGRQATKHFGPLAQQLSNEHGLLVTRINALKRKLGSIQSAIQQSYRNISLRAGLDQNSESSTGTFEFSATESTELTLPGDLVPGTSASAPIAPATDTGDLQEHLIHNVTQTGTESQDLDQPAASDESDSNVPGQIQIGIMPPNLFGR